MNNHDPSRKPVEGRQVLSRGGWRVLFAVIGGVALFALGAMLLAHAPWRKEKAPDVEAPAIEGQAARYFQPPPDSAIPDGPSGDAVRRGREIFMNTPANAGQYVGNSLSCSNCHLDGGRRANSAPMWAAWLAYPKYRSKNKQINTMEDRVRGCFSYSMNGQDSPAGGPPPLGDDIYKDLQTFMHWMATGAPTNTEIAGAGFLKMKKPEQGYDPVRGKVVYDANCAACHGNDGVGQTDINGRPVFPPLWGEQSYNWGAGMARIDTAAGFIKANMPLGQSNRLSDQEAWDVAAYIDSQERPRDPRQKGMSVSEAAEKFHAGDETYYGKTLNGRQIGVGTPVPASR